MSSWFERLAPDITATVRRFPLAMLLNAVALALLLANINEVLFVDDGETGGRLTAGFATGAIYSVAGQLYREGRPRRALSGLMLAYGLPLLVILAFQVRVVAIVVPFALPVAGVMWTSVAAFTERGRGAARRDNENRFWWLNYRAVLAAGIAGAAGLLILLGLASIERAMAILFNVQIGTFIDRWVVPVVLGFLVPLYWLATLPHLAEYDPGQLERPDIVATAGGFAAQFIAAPLLLVYAAILHAYAVQIAVAQALPQGLLGWMVLGFVVAGAATWLVLHPPFLRDRPVPRLFRRFWFWLTLIPLVLLAIAIFVRLDAYGLTVERLLVALGGLWAAVLAAAFLAGRGDIRLVPAVAGALLALFSVGPWNIVNLPNMDQAGRLDRALAAAGPNLDWTAGTASAARSAIGYLHDHSGQHELARVIAAHGHDVPAEISSHAVSGVLRIPDADADHRRTSISGVRDAGMPVDVTATPLMLGALTISADYDTTLLGHVFRFEDGALVAKPAGEGFAGAMVRVDLQDWVMRQEQGAVLDPFIDLRIGGRAYRFAVDHFIIDTMHDGQAETRRPRMAQGILFTEPDETNPPSR